ncbi:unknown [Prevotella sp. CAG:1185]|nr:unknown [Prevotella sp. CAG:1185]
MLIDNTLQKRIVQVKQMTVILNVKALPLETDAFIRLTGEFYVALTQRA